MTSGTNPVEWCKRMQDEAKDGDDAYNYFQLIEIWERKLQ